MKIINQIIFMGIAGFMLATAAAAQEEIVAQGDGFAITRQDIADIQTFFSERGFQTNEKEYVDGALKIFLFAEEASAAGLVAKSDVPLSGKEKIGRLYQVQKLYANFLAESYPLDKLAVASYYAAYPEKFGILGNPGSDKEVKQVTELDSKKKEWIRNKILSAKKTLLVENEFQRLKEKYHVKFR